MIIILMGVSGSGKSTVGTLLGQQLEWSFYDGDGFHSPENLDKMSQGIPLSDNDRQPWLFALKKLIEQARQEEENIIIACSGLKESYREYLENKHSDVVWIYLKGSYEYILQRMQAREEHFMKPMMLSSQFETLEEPDNAIIIDISLSLEEIIEQIIEILKFK